MFNKKRIIVFIIFILLMFFLTTFAGAPAEIAKVQTRDVVFTDSYGNKDISVQKVEVGKDAVVPEDPHHRNYVFAGWYQFNDHDIRVEKNEFKNIRENMHVIALYKGDINNNGIPDDEDARYTVRFIDSLDNTVLKTQSVLVGMNATAPKAKAHANYTFTGWDRGFSNVVTDIDVYALYRQNNNNQNDEDEKETYAGYTVEYYKKDIGKDTYTKEVESNSSVVGKTITLKESDLADRYEGFTLDTTISGTKLSGVVVKDGSLVLKVYYTRNSHVVIIDPSCEGADCDEPDPTPHEYGEKIKIGGDNRTYTLEYKEHKDVKNPKGTKTLTAVLEGYCEESSYDSSTKTCAEGTLIKPDQEIEVNKDVTYKAQWDESGLEEDVTAGEDYENKAEKGAFKEWKETNLGKQKFTEDTTLNADYTVTPQEYEIIVDPACEADGEECKTPDPEPHDYGTTVKLTGKDREYKLTYEEDERVKDQKEDKTLKAYIKGYCLEEDYDDTTKKCAEGKLIELENGQTVEKEVTGNATYKAVWDETELTVNITKGNGYEDEAEIGTFTKWTEIGKAEQTGYVVKKDTTLTAEYDKKAQEYEIIVDPACETDGEECKTPDPEPHDYGTTVKLTGKDREYKLTYEEDERVKDQKEDKTLKAYIKGYCLVEDYDDTTKKCAEGKLIALENGQTVEKEVTGNATYKAVWDETELTVNITKGNGYEDDKEIGTFTKWTEINAAEQTGYVVKKDTTLTAEYGKKPQEYEIIIDPACESDKETDCKTPDPEPHDYGTDVELTGKDRTYKLTYKENDLVKEKQEDKTLTAKIKGYCLVEDYDDTTKKCAEGKLIVVENGQTVKVTVNGNATYKAVWDETGLYTTIVKGDGYTTPEYSYDFVEWNPNKLGEVKITTDTELVAQYSDPIANEYKLTITYKYFDGTEAQPDYTETVAYGNTYTVGSPEIPGYTANPEIVTGTMPAKDLTVNVVYTANEDTKYTVKHYKQNIDGTYPEKPAETETKTGTTGEQTEATAKTYDGFTAPETVEQQTIAGEGTTVVEIRYTRNSYKITYKVTGSIDPKDPYETKEYKYEERVTPLTEPTKAGYTFSGWTDEPTTMPANDVTVEGEFTANTNTRYTVEHYKQKVDGTYPNTPTETEGKTGTTGEQTEASAKEYEGFTAPETVEQQTINGDGTTVVVIKYTRNSYKITYKVTGNVDPKDPYDTKEYNYEEEVTPLAEPEKAGYTFSGWTDEPTTMPAKDVTVEGEFTANTDTKYVVEHYKQNIDGTYPEKPAETENKTGTTGAQTEATAKEYEGFTAPETVEQQTINGEGTTVVVIKYTRNTYKITYKVTGSIDPKDPYETKEYKYEEEVTPLAKPTHTGYTFNGWTGEPDTMPAENKEATGYFNPNTDTKYTVKHLQEQLDESYKEVERDRQTLFGTTGDKTQAAANDYDGFTAPRTITQLTIAEDGSTVVEIRYTRNTYKITYAITGSVDANPNYDEVEYKYEQTVTPHTEPTKAGYTFSGWTDEPTTMPAEDITVEGEFTANTNTEYTVKHYKQNIDGTYPETATETETKTGTTDKQTEATAKTYDGFTAPETVEQKTIAGDNSTVVEIRYTRNSYKVTYAITGTVDANPSYAVKEYKYEETVAHLTEPTKAGYTFSGWATEPTTMPANDVTVEGSFTANTNTEYTVKHYKQNIDGTYPETATETETKTGTTDKQTEATAKSYEGFTAPETIEQKTIAGDNSTVVEIRYTRNSYTLTYKITGDVAADDEYKVVSYKYEEAVTQLAKPEEPGYTFNGWTGEPTTMPAENKEATGYFVANTDTKYTVEHYKQNIDGTYPESPTERETKEGTTGGQTAAVAKSYEGFTAPETIEQQTIAGDESTVVVIKYTRNSYTLTYKITGNIDANNAYRTYTYKFEEPVRKEAVPTHTGYTFNGWTGEPTTMPAANTVVTGYFEPNTNTKYTVRHLLEPLTGTAYTLKETEEKTGTTGALTKATAKTYPGFEAQAITQVAIAEDGTTVVDVKYTRLSYTITYKVTGSVDPQDPYETKTYKFEQEVTPLAKPEKAGYTFKGWTGEPTTMPAENKTVTGYFEANTDTKYVVKHYKQDLEGNYPETLVETEEKTGTTGAQTEATAKTYTGFTAPGTIEQQTINGEGTTVVVIRYTRNSYTLTYKITGDIDANNAYKTYTYKFEAPVSKEAVPTHTGYTFNGWTGEPTTMPAENKEVTGFFEPNMYVIKFVDDDDTELSSTEYAYGTKATDIVKPADPTKEGNAQYSYTFAGWTPEIADVTGTATYKATYTETVNKYTVKFVDDNGTQISSTLYDYGTKAADIVKPADPTKEGNAQYSYTFAGWTPEIADVTGDATYTATYTKTVNKYTVKFVDDNGTQISSTSYDYGTKAADIVKPADPTKTATAQYTYEFAGWTPEIADVTGDATYTATYTTTTRKYTVTFVDYNGTVLKEATEYDYGTPASSIVQPATPTRPKQVVTTNGNWEYNYLFAGWDKELSAVTANVTYKARYMYLEPSINAGKSLEFDRGAALSEFKSVITVNVMYDDGTVKASNVSGYEVAGFDSSIYTADVRPKTSSVGTTISYQGLYNTKLRYKIIPNAVPSKFIVELNATNTYKRTRSFGFNQWTGNFNGCQQNCSSGSNVTTKTIDHNVLEVTEVYSQGIDEVNVYVKYKNGNTYKAVVGYDGQTYNNHNYEMVRYDYWTGSGWYKPVRLAEVQAIDIRDTFVRSDAMTIKRNATYPENAYDGTGKSLSGTTCDSNNCTYYFMNANTATYNSNNAYYKWNSTTNRYNRYYPEASGNIKKVNVDTADSTWEIDEVIVTYHRTENAEDNETDAIMKLVYRYIDGQFVCISETEVSSVNLTAEDYVILYDSSAKKTRNLAKSNVEIVEEIPEETELSDETTDEQSNEKEAVEENKEVSKDEQVVNKDTVVEKTETNPEVKEETKPEVKEEVVEESKQEETTTAPKTEEVEESKKEEVAPKAEEEIPEVKEVTETKPAKEEKEEAKQEKKAEKEAEKAEKKTEKTEAVLPKEEKVEEEVSEPDTTE